MFVVLFEVQPHPELQDEYLDTAAMLRPDLEAVDGFVDNTRFASARTPGRVLSLSTWRDEKSLIRWRTQATHNDRGQQRGRFEIFADYRLRVAEVTHDTDPPAGVGLHQHRYDETEISPAKAATILEPRDPDDLPDLTEAPGALDLDRYDGILEPNPPLQLISWTSLAAAETSTPPLSHTRVRHVRVIREYGLHERREAPQYFPDVT